MNAGYTFSEYARAVQADLPVLLAAMAQSLAAGEAVGRIGRRVSLDRADLSALHDIVGRPAQAARWLEPLKAALTAQIDNELRPAASRDRAPSGAGPALTPAFLSMTLKDEQEVEEEIQLARFIQQVDATAEPVLRDLRPLAAALRQQASVLPESPLLHPQACAAALAEAVRRLALSPRARVACLQMLGDAWVQPLSEGYARHLRALKDAGVKPAQLRIRVARDATVASTPTVHTPAAQAGELPKGRIAAMLAQWVSHGAPDSATAEDADALPRELADGLMQHVLQTLSTEIRAAPSMQQVFRQLTAPAQRLAAREPLLWQTHDHPWWQVLDRLMALCAVLEDHPGSGQDALAAQCEPLVTQLMDTAEPDAALCQQLLGDIETVTRSLMKTIHPGAEIEPPEQANAAPEDDASQAPPSPQPAPLLTVLRDQMARQLRHTQAPASLRRFLLGPWVQALAQALGGPAADPARAQRYTAWVDRLLVTLAKAPEAAAEDMPALLAVAREGLQDVGLDEAQIESWTFDLTLRLSELRRSETDLSAADAGWRHDELPTVPIDLQQGQLQGARARRDREAWLRSLSRGDICRVFLDAQWRTLQLVDIDDDAGIYTLQGREVSEPYRCTRSALERLRAEGLVTTVEMGAFIAHAMDTALETMTAGLGAHGRGA